MKDQTPDMSLDLLNLPFLTESTPAKPARPSLIPASAGAHLARPLGTTPSPTDSAELPGLSQPLTAAPEPAPQAEQSAPARPSNTTELTGFWSIVDVLRSKAVDWHAEETADRIDLPESELHAMGWRHIDRAIIEQMRENVQTGGRDAAWTAEEQAALRQATFDAMFRLGRFQALVDEPGVENIHMIGSDHVWVEKAGGSMERRPAVFETDEQMMAELQFLAANAGEESRPFSAAHPDLDMDLMGSVRLAATARPVSTRPTAVFRIHRLVNITLEQLVNNGTLSPLAAEFLTALVQAGKTIVISGFGGDGKTTLMRALAEKIGPLEQIVTIEKERELHLDRLDSRLVPPIELQARPGSGERAADGSTIGEYTLTMAMEKALRLNSARILVGEVRGSEIGAMISAMQTGAGTYCTVHAYSGEEAVRRLVGLGMNEFSETYMARQLGYHIDVVVQMRKVPQPDGSVKRKIISISEVLPGDTDKGISVADLFRMGPGDENAVPVAPPVDNRLRNDLERTGFDLLRLAGGAR